VLDVTILVHAEGEAVDTWRFVTRRGQRQD
jgi:hypothetical protein